MSSSGSAVQKQRLEALDVFRGFTIIGMIIVNSPGTYGQLSHAYWDGLTIADFIFPFFIFIVGVAISLALKNPPLGAQQEKQFQLKVIKRTLIIFGLGLVVNLFYTRFAEIRVLGVLQRIALVYFFCSFLTLYLKPLQLFLLSVFILITYWLILLFVPAPGLEAGVLDRGNNIVNWLDYKIVPGMLWRGTWDPEGLLSTYPAIVTGLIGVLVGKAIVRSEGLSERVNILLVSGCLALFVGYVWSFFFLFNKALWSSSFVLVTGGVGCIILAQLLWLIDLKQVNKGTFVAKVFGTNAIAAYVLHVILEKAFDIEVAGASIHNHTINAFLSIGLPQDAATFVWISFFLVVCFLPIYFMYKRAIFLKV